MGILRQKSHENRKFTRLKLLEHEIVHKISRKINLEIEKLCHNKKDSNIGI